MNTNKQIRQQIVTHMQAQFGLPEQQLEQMLPEFIKTLREHLLDLEKAVASANLEHTGRAAHTIKGALLNLGLAECAEMASIMEKDAKALTMEIDYQEMVGDLRARLQPLFT